MLIKEKIWSSRIYELVFYENPKIRYKVSMYKYPLSNIKLVKYSKESTLYDVIFSDELTKPNFLFVKSLVKYIMEREYGR